MRKKGRLCDLLNSESDSDANDMSTTILNSHVNNLEGQSIIILSDDKEQSISHSTKKRRMRLADLDVDSDTDILPTYSSPATSLSTFSSIVSSSSLVTSVLKSSHPFSDVTSTHLSMDKTAITAIDIATAITTTTTTSTSSTVILGGSSSCNSSSNIDSSDCGLIHTQMCSGDI